MHVTHWVCDRQNPGGTIMFIGFGQRSFPERWRSTINHYSKGVSHIRAVTISSYNGWWMSAKVLWMCAVKNQWLCAYRLNDCVLIKIPLLFEQHTIIKVGTQSLSLQAHNHWFLTAHIHWTLALIQHPLYELMVNALKSGDHKFVQWVMNECQGSMNVCCQKSMIVCLQA